MVSRDAGYVRYTRCARMRLGDNLFHPKTFLSANYIAPPQTHPL